MTAALQHSVREKIGTLYVSITLSQTIIMDVPVFKITLSKSLRNIPLYYSHADSISLWQQVTNGTIEQMKILQQALPQEACAPPLLLVPELPDFTLYCC